MQDFFTYLIIISAVIAATHKIYKAIPFKTKKAAQGKCGSCATGCALKDITGSSECSTEDPVKIYL